MTDVDIVVRCSGSAGGVCVERYSRREGTRIGGGIRAELVNPDPGQPAGAEREPCARRVDAAYRAWSRTRRDREALPTLQEAVNALVEEDA